MWTIGDIKQRGKAAFKANYGNSVIAGVIMTLFVGGAGVSAKNTVESNQNMDAAMANMSPADIAIVIGILFSILMTLFIIGILFKIFIFNPIEVGCYRFFRLNAEYPGQAKLSAIGEGFGNYGRVFVTLLFRDLFLSLWTCLFVIPGIVKAYSYRLVPYILKDNPELSATQVITKSRQMMNGHKWKAFVLDISFIGWAILGALTLGIVAVFWTNPYKHNTDAALYQELKNNY